MQKKLLALILTLVMCLSLVPGVAWADGAIVVNDVEIYTMVNDQGGGYNDKNRGGIRTGQAGEDRHTNIVVPYQQVGNSITLFLITKKELATASNLAERVSPNAVELEKQTYKVGEKNVYALKVTPASDTSFGFWINKKDGQAVGDELLDFWFEKDSGQGDGSHDGPFARKGMSIFTFYDQEDGFGYDAENNGGLYSEMIGPPEGQFDAVMVPCQPNQAKKLYILPTDNRELTLGEGGWASQTTLTQLDDTYMGNGGKPISGYMLTLEPQENGEGDVTVTWNDGKDSLIFHFFVDTGNQGGPGGQNDGIPWTYVTLDGASKVTFYLTEAQSHVIRMPATSTEIDKDRLLTITVKNVDDELWRPMLLRDNDFGLMIPYEVESIEPEGTAKPQIAATAGGWTFEAAWTEMERRDQDGNQDVFHEYNELEADRNNGIFFAKSFAGTEQSIIVPEEDSMNQIWIWRYGEPEARDVRDGVTIRIQLEKDVAEAIVLENDAYPFVDLNRIDVEPFHYEELGQLMKFDMDGDGLDYKDGILTYRYHGELASFSDIDQQIVSVAEQERLQVEINNGVKMLAPYPVLRVTAPDGYVARRYATTYDQREFAPNEKQKSVDIFYDWAGLGYSQAITLTWCKGEGENYEEYVERLTINTPAGENSTKWMDLCCARMDKDRVEVPALPMACGAVTTYDNGLVWTEFNQNKILDVQPIWDAQVKLWAPEGAVGYRFYDPGDGRDDPTWNNYNTWLAEDSAQWLNGGEPNVFGEGEDRCVTCPLCALKEQQIGDIKYYYSADRGTWVLMVQWIFGDDSTMNEYVQLDTSPYICTMETEVISPEDYEELDPVEEPVAVAATTSNIKLVTRIHPQNDYGHYFFELEITEGEGNVIEVFDGTEYRIILPYSFMGEDWSYESVTAADVKTPIINHYDKNYRRLAGNEGAIKGEFTERGIEFVVTHFSPFVLNWEEPAPKPTHHGGAAVSAGRSFTTSFDGINAVFVDGQLVDSKYYTVVGKTVILSEEFLKTLGGGDHTFRAESATMKGESTFTVTAARTGDAGVVLYIALSAFCIAAVCTVLAITKKRRA